MGGYAALLFSRHVTFLDSFPQLAATPDEMPFVMVPVVPEIQTTICLAYLKDAVLTPSAAHFIDYCNVCND